MYNNDLYCFRHLELEQASTYSMQFVKVSHPSQQTNQSASSTLAISVSVPKSNSPSSILSKNTSMNSKTDLNQQAETLSVPQLPSSNSIPISKQNKSLPDFPLTYLAFNNSRPISFSSLKNNNSAFNVRNIALGPTLSQMENNLNKEMDHMSQNRIMHEFEIEDFQLKYPLGSGSTGQVFRATW